MKSRLFSGNKIVYIFYRKQEKNSDGTEKRITFEEYLTKINERAIRERKAK